jgi:hypothetical protein
MNAGDRYLDLLEVLLRRAADAVLAAESPGTHELRVRVLTRDVLDSTLGQKVPLDMRHLNRACVNAAGGPDRSASISRTDGQVVVRMITDAAQPFDEYANSAFVLADSLANRMFSLLHRSDCGLQSWCARLDSVWSMPSRLPAHSPTEGGLPLTAAGRSAHVWLDGVRSGAIAPLDSAALKPLLAQRPWAREQAQAWAAYFACPVPVLITASCGRQ